MRTTWAFTAWLLGAMALLAGAAVAEPPPAAAPVLVVQGQAITRADYDAALHEAARQRFFHGRPTPEQREALRHEVTLGLIDRVLLVNEARRRRLTPDAARREAVLTRAQARLAQLDLTPAAREEALGVWRQRAEEEALVVALEAEATRLPPASEQMLREYYAAHLDKFTTPARQRLGLILLKVAPSAPVGAWQAAQAEGKRLAERLKQGADFADLARIHSGDASAERGGDLGWVHAGMLAPEAQAAVEALAPGEVSAPLTLLQGVALFRVLERQPPQRNSFEQVVERVRGLWAREQAAQAWQGVLHNLRRHAEIVANDPALEQLVDEVRR